MIVDEICSSNCAEIILPSARKIKFENYPIIAFHGNTLSYRHYVNTTPGLDRRYCNWEYALKMESLYSESNLNALFWEEQIKRLKPNVTFEIRKGECPWRKYNFENSFWLPDSKQLKKLWGIKFSGKVCADKAKLCKKKIDENWASGTRVVIGDVVYTSKGR